MQQRIVNTWTFDHRPPLLNRHPSAEHNFQTLTINKENAIIIYLVDPSCLSF